MPKSFQGTMTICTKKSDSSKRASVNKTALSLFAV